MARQTIKDRNFRILGFIEDTHEGQKALHFGGRLLGTYTARDDYTREWTGQIIGKGNQLAALIDRAR